MVSASILLFPYLKSGLTNAVKYVFTHESCVDSLLFSLPYKFLPVEQFLWR